MIGRLLILAILTGIVTGLIVSFYGILTKFLTFLFYGGDPSETVKYLPWWYFYVIPTLSILLVNYMIMKDETVREYGVAEIAKAVEENRMDFNLKDLLLKIIASSISLASGFAVGNEGPSAAIGAMIAYHFHKWLKLPKNLLKIALSVGASSGIAAIFVSPITGIMFAIENIAYEFIKNYAGYLIIASVSAFSIAWHFLEPLIFNYSTGKFIEYRYIFSTLLFIPVLTFFIYFYLGLKDRVLSFLNWIISEKLKKYNNIVFALIGGFIIGTFMLISPFTVFSGHELVSFLINNKFHIPLYLIFIIIFLRIIATVVSMYANAVGGIFIALMSIGALIGYGYAEVFNVVFNYKVEPFYFAAIGAAVFMGVNMRLPLTAIVLALETTYDYNVIIPTGISVVIVTYLASLNFEIKKLQIFKKLYFKH